MQEKQLTFVYLFQRKGPGRPHRWVEDVLARREQTVPYTDVTSRPPVAATTSYRLAITSYGRTITSYCSPITSYLSAIPS